MAIIKTDPRLREARRQAASRQRRLIFNDDKQELALTEANTPEGFLGHRIAPLADTQVDTVAWSVLCGQFDAPAYDSKVQPIYGDAQDGPVEYWQNVTANVKTLTRDHACPLKLVTDFAYLRDMEAFASVRMNDVHDSFMDANALTTWKKAHPELLVDTAGMLPEFELYTTAQDFSHEEVRRRKLEIIAEIAQRYDVDGYELDYIRHPVLFSRRMRGEACTPEEIDIITSMMRQLRQITDAAAEKRGRPLLIAARVPDTFARCLDNGMDIEAWLEQDLVDILIAGGGYAPFSLPVAQFVRAAQPHGVPVYPCVNQSAADTMSDGCFLEGVRGLAASWYRQGAAGLYFWNLGTPFEFKTGDDLQESRARFYACLEEVGDRQTLIGKDKLFWVDTYSGGVLQYYAHISSPWPLPVVSKQGVLRTGVIGRVPLPVGDDVLATPPARATLTVAFDAPAWKEALLFRLNGEELTGGDFIPPSAEQPSCRLRYAVRVPLLRTGANTVELAARHVDLPEAPVTIMAVRLRVEYSSG